MTSAAETLPSHASLFTGLHPFEHGVRSNAGFVLAEQSQTLAEWLGDAGYVTGAEVAAPVLRRKTQITQGFGHYRGPESPDVQLKQVLHKGSAVPVTQSMRTGTDITQRGIEFMERYRRRRFFLWLHYFDTHDPYFAP